jgi:hypothetical protein
MLNVQKSIVDAVAHHIRQLVTAPVGNRPANIVVYQALLHVVSEVSSTYGKMVAATSVINILGVQIFIYNLRLIQSGNITEVAYKQNKTESRSGSAYLYATYHSFNNMASSTLS